MVDSTKSGNPEKLIEQGARRVAVLATGVDADMPYSAGVQDGKYLKKRNTFTDVVATAEHLIAEKYTSKSMLCIQVRQSFHIIHDCEI